MKKAKIIISLCVGICLIITLSVVSYTKASEAEKLLIDLKNCEQEKEQLRVEAEKSMKMAEEQMAKAFSVAENLQDELLKCQSN